MQRRQFLKLGGVVGSSSLMLGALSPVLADEPAAKDAAFSFEGAQFFLHQQPFQIRSGEMHPARIPHQYWLHRIQMARAMGMNTIAVYVIWNFHESVEGVFDFSSASHDIAAFIRLCQREGMWVLLRAGPYICGEWDFGGLPSYLLGESHIALRANSSRAPRYMAAASRYIAQLAAQVRDLMINQGGPILMVQIENEFGSFGSDALYLEELRQLWMMNGIAGPFYTQDGQPQLFENKTSVPGGAIGLSGGELKDVALTRKSYPDVPVFCGELYPGWLTHWGEDRMQGTDVDISATLRAFMKEQISFNIYVIHGGSNFGFTAGANYDKGAIQPAVTSYDYGAPITEQGLPNKAYFTYRKLIAGYLNLPLPDLPLPINTIGIKNTLKMTPILHASVWDNLPPPVEAELPRAMELLGQDAGFVLYRHKVEGPVEGALQVQGLNDYATVFLNEAYAGGFSRVKLNRAMRTRFQISDVTRSLKLHSTKASSTLDIFVEALGHINYGAQLGDRKGLFAPVTINHHDKVATLSGWQMMSLPMDSIFISRLNTNITNKDQPGLFFKLELTLDEVGDTFLNMRHWTKGMVWVNGNNLGRYWEIGPQHSLYCPATFLKNGLNEIILFDLHQTSASPVEFQKAGAA